MRSCNNYRDFVTEKEVFEGFGKGKIRHPPVQHMFDFRVSSGQCVADNNEIRIGLKIFRIVSLVYGNFLLCEKFAHRWIDAFVGSRDLVTSLFQHGCQ